MAILRRWAGAHARRVVPDGVVSAAPALAGIVAYHGHRRGARRLWETPPVGSGSGSRFPAWRDTVEPLVCRRVKLRACGAGGYRRHKKQPVVGGIHRIEGVVRGCGGRDSNFARASGFGACPWALRAILTRRGSC